MSTFKDKVKEACDNYQHIQWTAKHCNLYCESKDNAGVLQELEKYGTNVYTYPYESQNAYDKLQEVLLNNPYTYMSGWGLDEKGDMYSNSLDGYIFQIDQNIKVPLGFLKSICETEEMPIRSLEDNFLKDCLNRYHTDIYSKYIVKLEAGKKKYRSIDKILDLRVPEKFVYRHIVCYSIFLILLCIVLFLYRTSMKHLLVLGVILAYTIPMAMGIIGEFMCMRKKRFVQEKLTKIESFSEQYIMKHKESFNVSLFMENPNYVIEPIFTEKEYHKINTVIDDETVEKLTAQSIGDFKYGKKIFTCIIAVASVLLLNPAIEYIEKLSYEFQQNIAAEKTVETEETADFVTVFKETGFVFPDGDLRELTEEEIYELKNIEEYDFKTLLSFARNEFYARKGFAFRKDGDLGSHYTQYDWYNELEYREVTSDMFNSVERKNIDLIISVEKKEGYRQ